MPQTLFDFLELVNSLPEIRADKRVMRTDLRLQAGKTLLDIGCRIGIEACRIANECPGVRVIGLDRHAMIAEAEIRAGAEGASVHWLTGQAENVPLPDPARGVAEMARVLKPGGRLACFELRTEGHPMNHNTNITPAAYRWTPDARVVNGQSRWCSTPSSYAKATSTRPASPRPPGGEVSYPAG